MANATCGIANSHGSRVHSRAQPAPGHMARIANRAMTNAPRVASVTETSVAISACGNWGSANSASQ
ncbi:hypothetical protein D3C81_1786740 [compost metagenome]